MNPYKYSYPPLSTDLLESPTKLKTKFWPEKHLALHRKSNKYIYFMFCIGICLGFLLTNILREILKSNVCLSESFTMTKQAKLQLSLMSRAMNYENFSNSKKNLIFVGVMTANKYLSSRAKAVYETWGKYVPGKIGFFSSEESETEEEIPLIKLKGVDDSYPPQKKSFMMIKYMYDNFVDDYEFFMRADDDVYIRTDRLEKFLKSVNSSKLYYIGQPGRGNQDELGHLSLKHEENFCMGGPGMIFSKSTLEKIAPHIKKCLKNLKSLHEDVEIGRCVQKYAGIPCTWSYEMQNIFYHNSESKSFMGSLNQREVHRAITLHPIKNHLYLPRLHAYIKSLIIKEKEFEIIQAMREIDKFCKEYNLKVPSLDDAVSGIFFSNIGTAASLQKWAPKKGTEVLEWNFFLQNAYQLKDSNPRHRMTSFVKESTNDVIRDIMETINRLSKERGRVIDFKDTLYGYYRHNPTYSSEYILDMLLLYKKYRGKKVTMAVRRHAYVQNPFGPLYVKESEKTLMKADEENKEEESSISGFVSRVFGKGFKDSIADAKLRMSEASDRGSEQITFILPLSGRFNTFQRFFNDFQKICLEKDENVRLIVVSFRPKLGDQDTRSLVDDDVRESRIKYPRTSLSVVKSNSTFARALALELGAAQCNPNDLLFFVDVDMTFTTETLDKIRFHTIQGKQVYYPIVFSEFDPKVLVDRQNLSSDHLLIDEEVGYWRAFGFGIVALYQSDLRRVGGLDTSILGWGKEDIDLFEKVLKDKQLKVVRAPDPGLVHVFHSVDCDPKLEANQLKMCEGTQFSTYASSRTLAKILLQKPEILMFKRTQD